MDGIRPARHGGLFAGSRHRTAPVRRLPAAARGRRRAQGTADRGSARWPLPRAWSSSGADIDLGIRGHDPPAWTPRYDLRIVHSRVRRVQRDALGGGDHNRDRLHDRCGAAVLLRRGAPVPAVAGLPPVASAPMVDLISNLGLGFLVAASLQNLFLCLVGVIVGTLVGVLPGVGSVATIAMLLPITFGLPPIGALIMLAGIYYGAQYGGSTTSILVNIPAEATSVVARRARHPIAR